MNSKIVEIIMKESIPEKLANKYRGRFKYKMDRYDYVQEMYLILLEMDEVKLQDLYLQGELSDYFGKICINQLCTRGSAFHNKYMTYNNTVAFTDLSESLTRLFNEEIKPQDSFSLDYRDESFYYTYDD